MIIDSERDGWKSAEVDNSASPTETYVQVKLEDYKRLRALATQGGEYAQAYIMQRDTNTGIPGAEQYLAELSQLPDSD